MAALARPDTPPRPAGGLRLAGWSLAALVVALVRNRLWGAPNLPFFASIARQWGSNPFGRGLDGDYLLTNLLGPTVARLLGQTSPHAYARLHLIGLILGLAAVVTAAARRLGTRPAVILVWLLAASPAMSVSLEWLGQPDPATLCLALALPLCRRHWVAFGLAVLLGINHPEQGVVIAATAAVAGACLEEALTLRRLTSRGALLLGGVVVGRGVTQIYLWVNDITVSRPRTSFLCIGLDGFLDHHLRSPVTLLYSLWGPLWLVVIALSWRWWTTRRGPWPWVVATAAAALVPVAITLDETRVYSLTTATLLMVIAAELARWSTARGPAAPASPRNRRRNAIAIGVAIVVLAAWPGMFNAGDDYWATALRPGEFVSFLADGTVPGGPEHIGAWLMSPFRFTVPPAC